MADGRPFGFEKFYGAAILTPAGPHEYGKGALRRTARAMLCTVLGSQCVAGRAYLERLTRSVLIFLGGGE